MKLGGTSEAQEGETWRVRVVERLTETVVTRSDPIRKERKGYESWGWEKRANRSWRTGCVCDKWQLAGQVAPFSAKLGLAESENISKWLLKTDLILPGLDGQCQLTGGGG